MTSEKMDKARIETDTRQLFHIYAHIAYPETFEAWLDAKAAAWDNHTAREMIELGRVQEVIRTINDLF